MIDNLLLENSGRSVCWELIPSYLSFLQPLHSLAFNPPVPFRSWCLFLLVQFQPSGHSGCSLQQTTTQMVEYLPRKCQGLGLTTASQKGSVGKLLGHWELDRSRIGAIQKEYSKCPPPPAASLVALRSWLGTKCKSRKGNPSCHLPPSPSSAPAGS